MEPSISEPSGSGASLDEPLEFTSSGMESGSSYGGDLPTFDEMAAELDAVGIPDVPGSVPRDAPALSMEPGQPPPIPAIESGDGSSSTSSAVSAPPPEVFRAYDVRGVVGDAFNAQHVLNLGRAIGSEAYDRGQQTLVVGRDGRTTSPEFHQALIEGLRSSGRDVIDIGLVPTPVLYFATYYLNTGSGVMVTASHNPPEYNGVKIMLGGEPLFDNEIQQLRERLDFFGNSCRRHWHLSGKCLIESKIISTMLGWIERCEQGCC